MIQGGMPRNTRNQNRCVPISHPMMQKINQAWEPTIHEEGSGTLGNLGRKKKQPRKVAGDLSAWQKGINSLGKNDKRESSQKVDLKRWNLEALEKIRTKVNLLGPPRARKSARGF